MKNYHNIKLAVIKGVALMALFAGFSSCEDYLDKESDTELTLDMVFEDKDRMEGMLAYAYSGIVDPVFGYMRQTNVDLFGDEWTPSEKLQYWWQIPWILGNWPADGLDGANFWTRLPQRIREANIIREHIRPIANTTIDAQEVAYIKAECRFLQAYYYWLIANRYGPCPFQPDYITPTDASTEDMLTPRVPFDDIIDWCEKEMLAVSEILPATYSQDSKYGRITSIIALAMRARMLLFAASPLVNGNADYAGYTNPDGTPLFNSEEDPAKWTRAREAHRLLIEKAHAAGHELYKMENNDGTIDAFASTAWVHARTYANGNKELLFTRGVASWGGAQDGWPGYRDELMSPSGAKGNGLLGMTQRLVDAFFMDNGLPAITGYQSDGKTPVINAASGYSETGFSTTDDVRKTDNWNWYDGSRGVAAKAGTFNMYVGREPRFYNAILWNERYYLWVDRNVNFYKYGLDNDYSTNAPQNGYLGLKAKHPNSDSQNFVYPYRPGIIYRLAEAYLSYCEILNETDPGHPDILTYLNRVRERAGIRPYTTGATDNDYIHVDLGNQAEMRNLIRRERHVELCGEGIRYDDLRRWKKAEELLNGDFYGMNFSGTVKSDDPYNPDAFFVRTQYQRRVYHKKYYWYPIHSDELYKNPNLVQSPYWTEGN